MAKRLTIKQKEEIIQSFLDGKTIEKLSKEFNVTKLTIIRNLKINLGESKFKELIIQINTEKYNINSNKNLTDKNLNSELSLDSSNKNFQENETSTENVKAADLNSASSFMEIPPLEYQFENSSRKELSSVPISEVDLPEIVYMIIDKKIELEIKLLKDYPDWSFLPIDDLNRKTIEIYFDLKIAKKFCNKEQKVIKVPNTDVFRIAAPLLTSRGISRIVSAEKLIAL